MCNQALPVIIMVQQEYMSTAIAHNIDETTTPSNDAVVV